MIARMMKKSLLVLFLASLAVPVMAKDVLTFTDAWIREAPPMAKSLAGYVTIKNNSEQVVVIDAMSSPLFKKVKMHDMSMHNGMMHMSHLSSVTLQPNESIVFASGGKHLMLMKPKQPMTSGMSVPVTFALASGQAFTTSFSVRGKD